jgi:hypothetical protein
MLEFFLSSNLFTRVQGFEEKTKFQHLDTEKGNFYWQGGVVQNENCPIKGSADAQQENAVC